MNNIQVKTKLGRMLSVPDAAEYSKFQSVGFPQIVALVDYTFFADDVELTDISIQVAVLTESKTIAELEVEILAKADLLLESLWNGWRKSRNPE